jgi:polyisoprenoid-binding protein YceI
MSTHTKNTIRITIIAALAAVTVATADTYDIDTEHTSFGFGVKHMAVSTVKGSFKEYTGSFNFDPANPETFTSTTAIKVASINTENEKRDAHLRDADFFDSAKFPELIFVGEKLEKSGDGYTLSGKLTIKDITREVSFPVSVNGPIQDPWGNQRVGIEGALTINRQDYGLTFNGKLDSGDLVVGDLVKIDIITEGIKRK